MKSFVLGVHPSSRGFGWVLFDSPVSALDWGAPHPSRDKHGECLARLTRLLAQYRPVAVALEQFDGDASRRAPRIRTLATAMVDVVQDRGIEVAVYPRKHIVRTLKQPDTATRQDVAEQVARTIVHLRSHLPPPRKLWEGEHSKLPIFSAAACALTWYAQCG